MRTPDDRRAVIAAAVAELRDNLPSVVTRAVCHLLVAEIENYREANDTAEGNQIYRNQGAIQALQGILDRVLPSSHG